jgi:hypothetical protein
LKDSTGNTEEITIDDDEEPSAPTCEIIIFDSLGGKHNSVPKTLGRYEIRTLLYRYGPE